MEQLQRRNKQPGEPTKSGALQRSDHPFARGHHSNVYLPRNQISWTANHLLAQLVLHDNEHDIPSAYRPRIDQGLLVNDRRQIFPGSNLQEHGSNGCVLRYVLDANHVHFQLHLTPRFAPFDHVLYRQTRFQVQTLKVQGYLSVSAWVLSSVRCDHRTDVFVVLNSDADSHCLRSPILFL